MSGVPVDIMARLLDRSARRVQQLRKEPGFPPMLGYNEYDAPAVTLWYVRHLQAELARRSDPSGYESGELRAARLQLLAAQVERLRVENAFVRGDLVEIATVGNTWAQRVVNTRQRLRSIPSALGPQLTNKAEATYIVKRLATAVDQALEELEGDPAGRAEVPTKAEG